MRHRPLAVASLAAALLAELVTPAAAQGGAVTLDQIERRYLRMSEVYIAKCDKNGDQRYPRAEVGCVAASTSLSTSRTDAALQPPGRLLGSAYDRAAIHPPPPALRLFAA